MAVIGAGYSLPPPEREKLCIVLEGDARRGERSTMEQLMFRFEMLINTLFFFSICVCEISSILFLPSQFLFLFSPLVGRLTISSSLML